MNKTEENIKSKLRELKNIFDGEDKEKYSSDEQRKALKKYYDLVDLLNDKGDEFKEIYVMGAKSSPVGKPGPNRSRQREPFTDGGILGDDRVRYAEGSNDKVKKEDTFLGHIPSSMVSDEIKEQALKGNRKAKDFLVKELNMDPDALEMEIDRFQEDRKDLSHGGDPLPNEGLEELHKEKPDLVAKMLQKAEGGNVDKQMSMLMNNEQEPPMESDEEMEDNYLDFILDEALNEEEEDMLMSKLEQDEQLAMLFDKVVEVASEFAGSGPVEGPGTGVSDSIPARLSDGEFVFTAKAVEEIGADNLMAMMKDAEANADARQGMQNGGDVEEEMVTLEPDQEPARQEIRVVKETVDSPNRMIADEDEISKSIKSNMMLDPMQRHVRS